MPIRKLQNWLNKSSRKSAQKRRFEETLQRLAQRDVTDTVAEAEVAAWLAMLDGNSGEQPPGDDRPS